MYYRDPCSLAHGGYDPVYANEDSDRVLPVDVLREMEKEGKLYPVEIRHRELCLERLVGKLLKKHLNCS
mgnify:CR=1 FL=1